MTANTLVLGKFPVERRQRVETEFIFCPCGGSDQGRLARWNAKILNKEIIRRWIL
jgi:hypothetical protein